VGDRFHLVDDLVMLAFGYVAVDRPAEARAAALEALDLAADADSPLGMGGAFLALAFQANQDGRHEEALRLIGVVASLTERAGGGPPLEFTRGLIGDPEREARAHLSDDEASRAWDEGRAMTVEEAVDLARREHPEA
jgi:hypothetical protein